MIENTFDIQFRIFRRPIIAEPEKVTRITQAACVLRNYLKNLEMHCPASGRVYCPPGFIDQEYCQGIIIPGDWRTQGNQLHPIIYQLGSNA